MSGSLLDLFTSLLSLIFVGSAIKLMDDYLDAEYDICRGEHTLAVKLGRATLPYTLVLALLGAYLHLDAAIALFFGSYAVGMLSTWSERLPTRVPAYVEIGAAVLLSCWLAGWQMALWGLALMAMIDWLDDLIDMSGDRRSGQRNLALRLGVVETTLLTLIAMCAAVLTNPRWTVFGFIAFTMLTVLAEFTTSRLWQTSEENGSVEL